MKSAKPVNQQLRAEREETATTEQREAAAEAGCWGREGWEAHKQNMLAETRRGEEAGRVVQQAVKARQQAEFDKPSHAARLQQAQRRRSSRYSSRRGCSRKRRRRLSSVPPNHAQIPLESPTFVGDLSANVLFAATVCSPHALARWPQPVVDGVAAEGRQLQVSS